MTDTSPGIRSRPAILILVIMAALTGGAYGYLGIVLGEQTFQNLVLILGTLITAALLLTWWLFFSRAHWSTRLIVIAALVVLGITAGLIFRVDGVSGALVPRLSFRWEPTAEERAQELLSRQSIVVPESEGDPAETPLTAQPGDWTQFRGPNRDGIVRDLTLPPDWSPGEPLWKISVGLGWSSFAIVGNYAFTQEQRGDQEVVVCYAADSGQQRWVHTNTARFSEMMGGDGPRATPTFHEGYIYALGATGILDCLEAKRGTLVWSTNILSDAGAENLEWGMAGSPLVVGDLVIVSPGGAEQASLVAYDRLNGERRWGAGGGMASYSSATLSRIHNRDQVLIFNGDGLFAHDPVDGSILWQYDYTNMAQINVSQPVDLGDGQVLIPTGYTKGTVLIEVQAGSDETAWTTETVWQSRRLKPKFNNVVVRDGYAYGADEGILTCLDLATGKKMWKDGRFGYGQLLLIGTHLLIQDESGDLVLVKASPDEFSRIASYSALEGKSWTHPAVSRDYLLARNGDQAVAFQLSE